MRKTLSTSFKHLKKYSLFALKHMSGRGPNVLRPTVITARLEADQIVLTGQIFSTKSFATCTLTTRKFRDEHLSYDVPVALTGPAKGSRLKRLLCIFGLRWTGFEVTLNVPWKDLPASIYSLGISAHGKTSSPKVASQAVQILTDDQAGRTYCLFNDPAARVARIEMYHFGSDAVDQLRAHAQHPRPNGIHCVIGEYTNTARDNGQALFEALQADVSDIHASYIVEKQNADDYNVDQDGVYIFGGVGHLMRCLDAQICAFTHHRTYVYPYILHLLAPERYATTQTLFLQHGVIALKKNITTHYHADRVRYDRFCVSSPCERDLVVTHFGYAAEQVLITGLARFDRLHTKALMTPRHPDQVLIFPTWRKGLEKITSSQAAESRFILEWQAVLRELQASHLRTVLVLHPLLQRHAALFAPHVDEVRDIKMFQGVLVESAAMVTDYSSVTFDALFIQTPVFMYQFGEVEGGLAREAFINIDTQLPATLCHSVVDLLDQLKQSHAVGWPFENHLLRDRYFAQTDDCNTIRLIDVMRQMMDDTDASQSPLHQGEDKIS